MIENAAENNDVKRVIADEGLMIIMRISDIFLIIMALKLLAQSGKEGRIRLPTR